MSLGLVGGGRLGANTALAVGDLLAGIESERGEAGRLVELGAYRIEPIGDCNECIRAGSCSRSDAFEAVMEQVYEADLLVLGTPLYWYGPSAQLKAFLDRWSCLLDREEETFRARMRGKRTVLMVAQGERGFYEAAPCLQMLEWSLRYLDMPLAGRVVVVGHARTDYGRDRSQRDAVRAAGARIARAEFADLMPPWFHLRHEPDGPLGGIYDP